MEIISIYNKFKECGVVTTDTRTLKGGEMFFALKGENFDGHDFIPAAISRGAAYVICERGRAIDGDAAFIEVDDTLRALGDVSRGYLQKLSPPIIAAVTGSVGKTTTKEYLSSLCGDAVPILTKQH